MDKLLRRATPLVLLVLTGLVWFEKVLPGASGFREAFGEDAVPRFVIGVLCLYVLLLVIERQRMERAFKDVLGAFRDFHRKGGPAQPPAGSDGIQDPQGQQAQREAMQILIAALRNSEDGVQQSSIHHLKRLSGEDFGDDADAWQRWLDSRS